MIVDEQSPRQRGGDYSTTFTFRIIITRVICLPFFIFLFFFSESINQEASILKISALVVLSHH